MTLGRDDAFSARTTEDVVACFDATCVDLFAVCCHLTAGDIDWADTLLAETYVVLLEAAAAGIGTIDIGWLVETACRTAVAEDASVDAARGTDAIWSGDSTVAERAAIELHADVTSPAADSLRRYERWLDDITRERCRAAIHAGSRPRSRAAGDLPGDELPRTTRREPNHRAVVLDPDLVRRPPHSRPVSATDRSRRRLALVAAAGVVAVTATGFIAVGADEPVDRETSASVGGSGEGDASRGRVDPAADPKTATGYVLGDPPAGFRASGAYEQKALTTDGWFQLWAAPGATRTSGKWIAIASIGDPVSGLFTLAGSHSIEINGLPALEATDSDGVGNISMRLASGGRFTLAGFGLGDGQLRAVASEVARREGSLIDGLAGGFVDRDVELLVSAQNPFGNLASQARAGDGWSSSYQSLDLGRRMSLSSRPTSPNDLLVAQFLLPGSVDPLAPTAPARTIELGGLTLTVSAETAFDGKTVHTIQWHDGDNTITLSGTAGLSVLLAAVASVRPATADEWQALSDLPPTYYQV